MLWPPVDGVRSNGSWRMFTMVGMSVVTFGPGQPCGCWKNWNLKSSMRMAPSWGPPK